MTVRSLFFRFRVAVMVLLHLAGFFAPWSYFTGASHGTLWLAASTLVARTGWFHLAAATLTITLLGLACLVTGTALRVWGTAYLGAHIMRKRNPLYLGTWLIALATSLLMPPDGAAVFLAVDSGFLLFLVATENRFLAARLGDPYRPHWIGVLLNETYPIGFTLCFGVFAWRYNAHLLIRCLLICYGFSLVVRAMNGTTKDTNAV